MPNRPSRSEPVPAFPAPVDDGAARHLVPGLAMPDIALVATDARRVSLAAHPGWSIVFVYPWTGRPGVPNPPDWDDIPGAHGSTPEAEGFRNLHTAFRDHGAAVFGLSGQPTDWQAELVARLALPYPILSDASGALCDALRLPTFATGGVTYLKRLTLAIRDGRLVRTFYPVHPPEVHPREVLAWFDELVTRVPR